MANIKTAASFLLIWVILNCGGIELSFEYYDLSI